MTAARVDEQPGVEQPTGADELPAADEIRAMRVRIDEIDQVEALELDMAWTQELPEGLRDPGEDHVEVEIGDHDVRAGRRLGGRPCRGE